MCHVPDFLKINDEDSMTEYLLRVLNTPIEERYGKSAFELDISSGIDDAPFVKPVDDESEEEIAKNESPAKKGFSTSNDLTGRQFGLLTVRCLDEEKSAQARRSYWICDCKCGGSKSIRADALLGGKTTSCGCVLAASRIGPKPSMMRDLTGQRFGKLKAIKPDESVTDRKQGIHWICECDCGNISSVRSVDLVNGKTKSCGHCRDKIKYNLNGEYGVGYTTSGTRFLFDKEDYEKIAPYTWGTDAYGYIVAHLATINGERKSIKMHRLVMGVTDPEVHIDHIGHDIADNRKSQLRIASRNENMHNRQLSKSNTTGRTGVYYDKDHNKWRAAIRVNGCLKYLGLYDSFDEACRVRDAAENYYFKDFKYKGNSSAQAPVEKPINPFESVPRRISTANTSGHTGVSYDSSRHNWRAFMTVDGKQVSIGAYPTYEEACKAREAFEKMHKNS